jgi:hypothetical protein
MDEVENLRQQLRAAQERAGAAEQDLSRERERTGPVQQQLNG